MNRIAQRKLSSNLKAKFINNQLAYFAMVQGRFIPVNRAFAKSIFEGAV